MTDTRRRVATPADTWLVLGVAVAGVLFVTATGLGVFGSTTDVIFGFLAISAIAVAVVGLRRWRPEPAWPWWLQVGAMVLFLVGALARASLGTLGNLSGTRSLLPDLLTLPGYVLVGVSMLALIRLRRSGASSDLDASLDSVVTGAAGLTLAWVFLINPAVSQYRVPLETRMLLATYPAVSVSLLALAVRLWYGSGRKSPFAVHAMLATVCCILIGDVLYMFADARLSVVPTGLLDLPYGLAYVAIMATVLHPSIRDVASPVREIKAAPRPTRVAFLAVALCAPALAMVSPTERTGTDRWILSGIMILSILAVVWRMVRALQASVRAEARLAHQASHDGLTGLPNRMLVQDRLDIAIGGSGGRKCTGLLLLDLDRFKVVNDLLGHGVGDEVLTAVGERLLANQRPGDLVGRIGGDEFVVMLRNLRDADHALEIADRTRLSLARGFVLGETEIPVTTSIGLALCEPGDWSDTVAETMFRDADTAMYQAKEAGGDGVAIFDGSMRFRVARRLELERELRHALGRGELRVVYQPVVRAQDGRVTGMEALLRWSHPNLGEVAPVDFIPIAEDTGAIVEIGAWVINQACTDLARLREMVPFGGELSVAVNLSVRQLRDSSLLDHVARSLLAHRLPASALKLELTESMVMENLGVIATLLASLRSCGVRISIDDFGTGYSSLSSLERLPVDEVKIDQSFVARLGEEGANTSLVAAVVAIAESLGIATVAEGVEEPEQARRIAELGCQMAQGYLFSRPVPMSELPDAFERLGVAGAPTLRAVPTIG